MRNFGIALIAAVALCVASPALAGFGSTDNSTNVTNTANGGNGGNARAGARAGANANSRASGGDARAQGGNSRVGPVGNNSGNSRNSNANRNSNDSSARVGNVGAYSGVDFDDARIGNSRNTNDLSNRNRNSVDTSTSTSTSTQQGQQQGQIQGQLQGQQFTDSSAVTVTDSSDNSTFVEAADIPVASAAPVFASACSAGVSGQSMGFGGSLATTNPMCDMALAAEMARAVGNDELAYELTMEAATFARARTNIVRRFGQWIPFVGSLW